MLLQAARQHIPMEQACQGARHREMAAKKRHLGVIPGLLWLVAHGIKSALLSVSGREHTEHTPDISLGSSTSLILRKVILWESIPGLFSPAATPGIRCTDACWKDAFCSLMLPSKTYWGSKEWVITGDSRQCSQSSVSLERFLSPGCPLSHVSLPQSWTLGCSNCLVSPLSIERGAET